jgi:putative transposase
MPSQNLIAGYTREEIKEIVIMIRLELYNNGLCCGAKAIKNKMENDDIEPVPSESTIKRILSNKSLTHGRIGFYD